MRETRLDLRGLKCPLPALKTRKALRGIVPGEALTVLCTDPMAAIDIPHLCRELGHPVESGTPDRDGVLTFRITAAESTPAAREAAAAAVPPRDR